MWRVFVVRLLLFVRFEKFSLGVTPRVLVVSKVSFVSFTVICFYVQPNLVITISVYATPRL